MGLIGFLFELVVLGCLIAGIASAAAVVGTCDMLVLGRGAGSIGPWRANIDGMTDGCVGWNKSDTDADDWLTNILLLIHKKSILHSHIYLRNHIHIQQRIFG